MNNMAYLFPGQGSQYIGMGKYLYDNFKAARTIFEEANAALSFDLARLCFEGSLQELTQTANAQPAILTASVAAFHVHMQETGLQPKLLAGHSLGEITALTCAEAIPFMQAVSIVRQRGVFMQEAVGLGVGMMAAVSGASVQEIRQACSEASDGPFSVVISNYNTPEQTVISGDRPGVERVSQHLQKTGAVVIPLKVSAPFHSPLMQPAAEKLREFLASCTYSELKWPVISNVTAAPYPDHRAIVEMLSMQMTQPVRWVECMTYLASKGITTAVELGPQTVLRNLMARINSNIRVFAYDKPEDAEALTAMAGSGKTAAVSSRDHYKVITRCLAVAVCTRNRSDSSEGYEKGVVEPYRDILRLQLELENQGKVADLDHAKQALSMLRSVFLTKRTPLEEQRERYRQILDETGTGLELADFTSVLLQREGMVALA